MADINKNNPCNCGGITQNRCDMHKDTHVSEPCYKEHLLKSHIEKVEEKKDVSEQQRVQEELESDSDK